MCVIFGRRRGLRTSLETIQHSRLRGSGVVSAYVQAFGLKALAHAQAWTQRPVLRPGSPHKLGGEPVSDQSHGLGKADVHGGGLHDLYRMYTGWLTARLRKRFGDETEDLVQEAWLRAAAYSRRGVISHPKALLMTIVDNLAIDRARRGNPKPLLSTDRISTETPSDLPPQADALLLKQIILGMPPKLQEVFVLSRFVHLEYQEISARLNIPVTTVQWRMTQALAYCAAQLRL